MCIVHDMAWSCRFMISRDDLNENQCIKHSSFFLGLLVLGGYSSMALLVYCVMCASSGNSTFTIMVVKIQLCGQLL